MMKNLEKPGRKSAVISSSLCSEKYQRLSRLITYITSHLVMSLIILLLLALVPVIAQTNTTKSATIDASLFPTLQAAFNAVPEGGGEVIIPPGTYELFTPLILTSEDTHIKGAGTSTHLINRNENGEPALVITPKESLKKSSYIWRIQLSDFRVSGNRQSGDGILFERVNELHISGLMVDHNGGNGISINRCPENPRINHCNITYNAKAGMVVTACDDVVISANQFEENEDGLRFIDGYNLTMTGNNIDDHLRHGIVVESTYGSVISGNMIEECKGTAIILQGNASSADRHCYGFTICSNVIAHNLGGGVKLTGAWSCSVSANTFTVVHNNSIMVGPGSGRITITGNNFGVSNRNVDPANEKKDNPWTWHICTGIDLQGTSDITVSGNCFARLIGEAVKADAACNRILITGNLMKDLGLRTTGVRKAIDLGGAKGCVVKNNLIGKDLKVK
jgi:hypothetical protein